MRPLEREEMNRLCRLIQDEQDPKKFIRLVEQLNDLLGDREHELQVRAGKPE